MKKVIIVASILMVVTSLESCKKTYSCQCTKNGNVTYTTTVSAKSSSDAKSYCSLNDNSSNGSCDIK